MADNLVDIFQVMTNEEIDAVIRAYNFSDDTQEDLHPGKLPFLNRKDVIKMIGEFIAAVENLEDEEFFNTGTDEEIESSHNDASTLEVFEAMLRRVRLTPLTKSEAKRLRERIRDRIERGTV